MAFCPNCGSQVDGRFCSKCGTAMGTATGASGGGASSGPAYSTGPNAPPYNTGTAASAGMSENVAAALCYLVWLITGIIFLLIAPYNQNRLIRFHAFQSIFLGIAWIALSIAINVLHLVFLSVPGLGLLMSLLTSLVLGLGGFILWIFMLFKTYNGQKVVLPVIGPLAEKQANA